MGITKIDEDVCSGCKICVTICPTDVIRFNEEREKAVIAYPLDCCTCYFCEEDCPESAITVSPEATRVQILPY